MKLKRLISFGSALLVSLSSLFVIVVPHAFAAASTWDGGGGDANFSTAANWVGDVAPIAGDSLVFPALGTKQAPVNDTTLTYAGISFTGASGTCSTSPYAWYTLTGTQPLSLSGNIDNSMTGSCSSLNLDLDITLTTNISVTGTNNISFGSEESVAKTIALGTNIITFSGSNYVSFGYAMTITGSAGSSIVKNGTEGLNFGLATSSFSSSIILNGGQTNMYSGSFGSNSTGTTVNTGASLFVILSKDSTFDEPIILNGASNYSMTPKFGLSTYGQTGDEIGAATYAGALTLGSNATIGVSNTTSKVTFSGTVTGAFTITRLAGETGQLVLNASTNNSQTANGDIISARLENAISANQAYGVYVNGNDQTTINEGVTVTGNSSVFEDGILIVKGKIIGTVLANDDSIVNGSGVIEGPLTLSERAKLAPGLSPGCIATGNLTFVAGTSYEFEVGGATECTEYDQTKVTGTVALGDGTLNTVRYNDFKPVKGQSYKIIDNDSADAVTGTFKDLAEGATFTVDGYVLKISYVGGDGNDVVLTVQSVPTVPDTGFRLVKNNPAVTLVATMFAAGGILGVARRYNKVASKR